MPPTDTDTARPWGKFAPVERAGRRRATEHELRTRCTAHLARAKTRLLAGTAHELRANKTALHHAGRERTQLAEQLSRRTAQLAAETVECERVHVHEQLFGAAIEQLAEGVLVCDDAGTIAYVNPAFERITGYTRDETIGRTPRMLNSGSHTAAFYAHLWQTIRDGNIWHGQFTNRRKDGSLFAENAIISPVRNTAGDIAWFVKIGRDLTREQKLQTQLQQAQKMEAIGTLAGGIAHDLNNILTAILGYAQLAQYEVPPASLAADHLQELLGAGDRMRDLVTQILTFSRQTDRVRHRIHPARTVTDVLRLLRAGLPSTIAIETALESDAAVVADPTEVHQVVMNLCANAAHAMHDRGTLTVRLAERDLDGDFCAAHPRLRPGPHLCLEVEDTGTGIPPELLPRIFEPYFTTKKLGEGTGLGLAVVHGIVTGLGGDITVYSEADTGTVFRVYLPTITDGVEAPEAELEPLRGGTETVLIADDEPQIRHVMRCALERLGYHVTACATGMDALDRIRAEPEAYALVVTDHTMPGMTGVELAQHIATIHEHMPVLLCTGFRDVTTAAIAQAAGIVEILPKPLTPAILGRAVRRALDAARA